MKRFSIGLVLAIFGAFFGYSSLGQAIAPQPEPKTIATVVAHAHHVQKFTNFLSATDKM